MSDDDATEADEARGQELVALFNAAPDMLEVLKDLLSMAESMHEVPPVRADAARAAIAKATADSSTPTEEVTEPPPRKQSEARYQLVERIATNIRRNIHAAPFLPVTYILEAINAAEREGFTITITKVAKPVAGQ